MNETYNAASIAFFAGTAILVAIPTMLAVYLLRLVLRERKDLLAPRTSPTDSKDRRARAQTHGRPIQSGQAGGLRATSGYTSQPDDFVTPMLVAAAINSSLSSDNSNCDTGSPSQSYDSSNHNSYDCGSSSGSAYDSSSGGCDSGSYSSSGSCGID